MKKAKVILTALTFTLAIAGVVVAKANGNKMRSSVVYYDNGSSFIQLGSAALTEISAKGVGQSQAIITVGANQYPLYTTSNGSTQATFTAQ